MDAICEYLEGTAYAGGAEALRESPSAFERWCDNQLMEAIKPQKYNPFSAGRWSLMYWREKMRLRRSDYSDGQAE